MEAFSIAAVIPLCSGKPSSAVETVFVGILTTFWWGLNITHACLYDQVSNFRFEDIQFILVLTAS